MLNGGGSQPCSILSFTQSLMGLKHLILCVKMWCLTFIASLSCAEWHSSAQLVINYFFSCVSSSRIGKFRDSGTQELTDTLTLSFVLYRLVWISWLYMAMYDYVWLCMTMYEYVWICWIYMTVYDYVRLRMNMYEFEWLYTTMYD